MVLLENLTSTKSRAEFRKNDIAIIPVGSTEQHGAHLPLGTDHFLARYIAREVADRTGILCTPTIPIGISDSHKQFFGTLSVKPQTLKDYVGQVCLSLKSHGIRKVVIYNGHGGNQLPLEEEARVLRSEHKLPTFVCHVVAPTLEKYVDQLFGREGEYHGAHGGAAETSLIMAMHEDLVDKNELKRAKGADKWGREVSGTVVTFDAIDFSTTGTVGLGYEGTKERGVQLLNRTIEETCSFVEWLKKTSAEELLEKPHVD
jgi:creatinine amidohydrolase